MRINKKFCAMSGLHIFRNFDRNKKKLWQLKQLIDKD